MALPTNWTTVLVYGRYLRLDGMPNTGSVSFTSRQEVWATDDNGQRVLVVPRVITAPLDDTGAFQIALPSTDDPDIAPTGWTYAVHEAMPGGDRYTIEVPAAAVRLNLVTWTRAQPVPVLPPVITYLQASDIGQTVASQATMDATLAQSQQAAMDAAMASGTATTASNTALQALTVANGVDAKASQALNKSATAITTANNASASASAAVATANGIDAKASQALNQSTTALNTANGIDAKATNALNTANSAQTAATQASSDASNAVTTANSASATANGIDAKATNALNTANAAQTAANNAQTAANGKQPLDGTLTALAALVTAADQMIYSTGADAFSQTALTAYARTLLAGATAAAMRTTLGLGGSATLNVGTATGTVAAGDDARFLLTGLKNKLINGGLDLWQRGTPLYSNNYGTGNAAGYGPDRWQGQVYGGSSATGTAAFSITQQSFAVGQTAVTGNPVFFARMQATSVPGLGGGGAAIRCGQLIEDVRSLSDTVTCGVWLKADSARTIGVTFFQNFGGGGSASVMAFQQAVAVTTSWAFYKFTFTMPSMTGKTINAGSSITAQFWLYAQDNSLVPGMTIAPFGAMSTSAYLDMANAQIEAGSFATAFEKRPVPLELMMAQRYYEKSYDFGVQPGTAITGGYINTFINSTAIAQATFPVRFAVVKRAPPSVSMYSPVTGALGKARDYASNVDVAGNTTGVGTSGFGAYLTASASNLGYNFGYQFTAEAEL